MQLPEVYYDLLGFTWGMNLTLRWSRPIYISFFLFAIIINTIEKIFDTSHSLSQVGVNSVIPGEFSVSRSFRKLKHTSFGELPSAVVNCWKKTSHRSPTATETVILQSVRHWYISTCWASLCLVPWDKIEMRPYW